MINRNNNKCRPWKWWAKSNIGNSMQHGSKKAPFFFVSQDSRCDSLPAKQETSTQWWANAGPAFAHHWVAVLCLVGGRWHLKVRPSPREIEGNHSGRHDKKSPGKKRGLFGRVESQRGEMLYVLLAGSQVMGTPHYNATSHRGGGGAENKLLKAGVVQMCNFGMKIIVQNIRHGVIARHGKYNVDKSRNEKAINDSENNVFLIFIAFLNWLNFFFNRMDSLFHVEI